jgi:hypothetical protein
VRGIARARTWSGRLVVGGGGGRTFWWRTAGASCFGVRPLARLCGADILFLVVGSLSFVNAKISRRNENCRVVKMAANGKESSELTLTVLGCGKFFYLSPRGSYKFLE